MASDRGKKLIWRGALGGMVGGYLGAIILIGLMQKDIRQLIFFVLFQSPILISITVITGVLAGAAITWIQMRIGREPGTIIKAIVSATIMGLAGLLFDEMAREWRMTNHTMSLFFTKHGLLSGIIVIVVMQLRLEAGRLWRSAAGGLLGGLFGFLILTKLPHGPGTVLLILIFLLFPVALVGGVMTGATIWWARSTLGRNIGVIFNAIIGATFAGIFGAIYCYLLNDL